MMKHTSEASKGIGLHALESPAKRAKNGEDEEKGMAMKRFETYSKRFMWSVALLLTVFFAGCGHWDGGDETPGGETIAPTVISTGAPNGATGLPINRATTAVFSEKMDPLTISATTFTVRGPGGTPVSGNVTYAGITATFKPGADLAAGTLYTSTITVGARDLAGNPLAANYVWSWTTGAALDTTAPTVTATTPLNNATGVAINIQPTATFSEEMDASSINTATYKLAGPGATPVAGTVTYVGVTATFRPSNPLASDTLYTSTVTVGSVDLAGNPLAANYVWTWRTGVAADTTAPRVTSTDPLQGATGVALNKHISATFSEAMDPLTITTATFKLTGPGATPVSGTVTYAGVTALFIPYSPLTPDTLYTSTITVGAKDLAGNPLAANYVWTWRTGSIPDDILPRVIFTDPARNATGVALNKQISATFSEAMDPLTISNVTFTLTGPGTTPVPGTVNYAGVTATFQPLSPLLPDTFYTSTISGEVKDLAGNSLTNGYVWSWRTGGIPDNTAPMVISTVPANGASGVAINIQPTATFSEAMDPLTITSANFTLTGPGLTTVDGMVTYAGVTANFRPLSNLANGTTYTATIKGGAGGVKDLAGNPLAANYVWTFQTGAAPDITAPRILFTIPFHTQGNVPLNQEITAIFSEAMDPLTITDLTFTLYQGLTQIDGNISYLGTTATFAPLSPLEPGTTYTVEITNGAQDLAHNPLGGGGAPNPWTFTTAATLPPPGPALVNLTCAANFGILAGSTVTSTGPSIINGDLGLSPGSAVVGFPPGTVNGTIFSPISPPEPAAAKLCLTAAYLDAQARTVAPITLSGNIGGLTLAPGLYKSTSTLAISGGDLTLAGPADGVWIFQIASTLTTTSGRQVILSGGALAKNIFWQVGTSATLGTTSVFQGTIMADQSITLETGATLNGRALTQIGAVTLDSSILTVPTP